MTSEVKRLPPVDVVIVGFGWSGSIVASELAGSGLRIVALERGGTHSTEQDASAPWIRDELKYLVRKEMMQNTARSTVTVRNHRHQTALPMREMGSFLPGEAVGGSGLHWSGFSFRWNDQEFQIRSRYRERYGPGFIDDQMTIQDWGVRYAELAPFYERYEQMAGVSGQAGNIDGQLIPGGNPFEAPRRLPYPLPPIDAGLAGDRFDQAARAAGYHPFPIATAKASRAYTNPDGIAFGECQYCGFCGGFGCEANAKASPHLHTIPIARRNPAFEIRPYSWVTRIRRDGSGRRATGVDYVNLVTGARHFQPADLVLLSSYALGNVHLMLLSGIGEPYDPASGSGLVGKNYCYQTGSSATLFFDDDLFHPYMSAGLMQIDDFYANPDIDHRALGYAGGFTLGSAVSSLPISSRALPAGTPPWGAQWKRAAAKWYARTMRIGSSGSVMAHRDNYLDLDPTYRDALGQPLLRMTFDYRANEQRQSAHCARIINELARSLDPTHLNEAVPRKSWSVVPYQSTHNTGGTIMGNSPSNSVVNKYGQVWSVDNLFITGASVFAHNGAYPPTALVCTLAYFTADALKSRYLKRPGALV